MLNRRFLLASLPGLMLVPVATPPAWAHDYTAGDIAIGHPWSRAAPANVTGAGFMRLRNSGAEADRLVAARAEIARAVELHNHIRDGEVMRMRPVPFIELPPGAEVVLAPGGYHMMLIGLKRPLVRGERVPVTLVFARAGEVAVELAVEAAGFTGGGGHTH